MSGDLIEVRPAPLFAPERKQRILRQVRSAGRVDAARLAAEFAVTTETIRRDLTALEQEGYLRRVHGGAITVTNHFVPDLTNRASSMRAQKHRIAEAAVREVPTGGSILIDAGTTTARLADVFPRDRQVTVVTNALPIASKLAGLPNLTVHTLGGRIRSNTLAEVDAWALESLARVFVDVAFLATYGVSVEHGCSTPDPSEAAVKRAMITAAQRVVLLADSSKIGVNHFARFADLPEIDLLITDDRADPRQLAQLRAAGLSVEQSSA